MLYLIFFSKNLLEALRLTQLLVSLWLTTLLCLEEYGEKNERCLTPTRSGAERMTDSNRQDLFVILRDFSGLTQVLIPQEEVRVTKVAGVAFLNRLC